ncbi:MAG: hypothetical protein VCA55_15895, partial [Verrucomicrobiales bacterium]
MYATQKQMGERKSKADDAGTPDRNFQFMATQLTNLFTSAMEYSDTQAAGKVLGNKSEYASHDFWYVYASPLVNWQRKHQARRRPSLSETTYMAPPVSDGSDDHTSFFDDMAQ